MYGFHKYILKHPLLGFFIYLILLLALLSVDSMLYAVLPDADAFITDLIAAAFLAFIISYFSVPDYLNKKAVLILNNGANPQELFDVMSICFNRRLNKRRHFVFASNYAAALLEMGRAQEAYNVLYSIKDSKLISKQVFGFVFYDNMSVACEELGDFIQANEWYVKMVLHYNALPRLAVMDWATMHMRLAEIRFDYRHGNFAAAMKKLDAVNPANLTQDIEKARLTADIALALGQKAYAASAMRYVIAKGNKLYAVQRCRAKLTELESEGI